MNIGHKIKEFRKDKGLTQQQLADLISVTKSSLQKYENGQTAITVDLLERISIALDIDIVNFFTDSSDDILLLIKKRLNLMANTHGRLEYDFKLFMEFLKFRYSKYVNRGK